MIPLPNCGHEEAAFNIKVKPSKFNVKVKPSDITRCPKNQGI
jgi:hypothetical protein